MKDFQVRLDDILAEGNIRSFSTADDAAKELLTSVKALGVLQPVLLTLIQSRRRTHRYRLVAGFRRYAAARQAGLRRIPARLLGRLDGARLTEVRLTENFNRLEMTPMEEARGLGDFMRQTGLNQYKTAERLGRSQTWVSFRVRFLEFPAVVREMIHERRLSVSNAAEILPYLGKNPEEFIVRAARVGCWTGNNMGFRAALAGGLRSSHPKGAHVKADGSCACGCRCCVDRGSHKPPAQAEPVAVPPPARLPPARHRAEVLTERTAVQLRVDPGRIVEVLADGPHHVDLDDARLIAETVTRYFPPGGDDHVDDRLIAEEDKPRLHFLDGKLMGHEVVGSRTRGGRVHWWILKLPEGFDRGAMEA